MWTTFNSISDSFHIAEDADLEKIDLDKHCLFSLLFRRKWLRVCDPTLQNEYSHIIY